MSLAIGGMPDQLSRLRASKKKISIRQFGLFSKDLCIMRVPMSTTGCESRLLNFLILTGDTDVDV